MKCVTTFYLSLKFLWIEWIKSSNRIDHLCPTWVKTQLTQLPIAIKSNSLYNVAPKVLSTEGKIQCCCPCVTTKWFLYDSVNSTFFSPQIGPRPLSYVLLNENISVVVKRSCHVDQKWRSKLNGYNRRIWSVKGMRFFFLNFTGWLASQGSWAWGSALREDKSWTAVWVRASLGE